MARPTLAGEPAAASVIQPIRISRSRIGAIDLQRGHKVPSLAPIPGTLLPGCKGKGLRIESFNAPLEHHQDLLQFMPMPIF